MTLNPKIWGPKYWFFLYTTALTYPNNPNEITKKKYYDFIQNFPLFIPVSNIGNEFSIFLDKYPVTPYLDSRESFIKWIHFIHNRINVILNKPEITLKEAYQAYHDNYKPKIQKNIENILIKKKYIYFLSEPGGISYHWFFALSSNSEKLRNPRVWRV